MWPVIRHVVTESSIHMQACIHTHAHQCVYKIVGWYAILSFLSKDVAGCPDEGGIVPQNLRKAIHTLCDNFVLNIYVYMYVCVRVCVCVLYIYMDWWLTCIKKNVLLIRGKCQVMLESSVHYHRG